MTNLNINEVGWKASSDEGVVAAGSAASVMAGVNILNEGGNAVDAAVATIFALNVTDHGDCSIGGEVPIMIYDAKSQSVKVLSGQGRAPLSQEAIDWYLRNGIPGDGDIKMTPVPSVVDSCITALRLFGTRTFEDVISSSKNIILDLSPNSIEDIRNASGPVIRFSDKKFLALKEIKSFLFNNMYRSPKVIEMRKIVTFKLKNLFKKYINDPSYLPSEWKQKSDLSSNKTDLARLVADYISGMTDRYALTQHSKVCEKNILR